MRKENIHPEALSEFKAAAHWYDERQRNLGDELLTEVKRARLLVRKSPESWPRHIYRTRRFVLRRFPFSVVYRTRTLEIQIIAVAHHSRRPGYWKNRTF
ncbi:MAG: type II toxin-antitoxin system RelE/ParE family toxin [Bacteroidota bacterium]